jgi:hypothetical protein
VTARALDSHDRFPLFSGPRISADRHEVNHFRAL